MEEAETTKTVDPFTDGLELIGNGGQASNNYYEDKGFHDGEKNGQAEAYRNGYKFGAFQGWYIGTELGYAQSIAYTVLSAISSLYPEYGIKDIPNIFSDFLDPSFLSGPGSFFPLFSGPGGSSLTDPIVPLPPSTHESSLSKLAITPSSSTEIHIATGIISNDEGEPPENDNVNTFTLPSSLKTVPTSGNSSSSVPTNTLQRLIRTAQQILIMVQQFPLHNYQTDFDTMNEIQRIRAKTRVLIVTARSHLGLNLDPDTMVDDTNNNGNILSTGNDNRNNTVIRNRDNTPVESGSGELVKNDSSPAAAVRTTILSKEKIQTLSF